MIRAHTPTGWNTWDYRSFNRLVYLNKGRTELTLQAVIWDEHYTPADQVKNRGGLRRTFRWSDVTRLGPHAPLGLPAELEFQAGGTPFRFEADAPEGLLSLRVRPLDRTEQRVVFLFVTPAGERLLTLRSRAGNASAKRPARAASRAPTADATFAKAAIVFDGVGLPADYSIVAEHPFLIGAAGKPAAIHVLPGSRAAGRRRSVGGAAAPRRRDALARKTARRPVEPPTITGGGALADAPEAMIRAVTWNTLYDARRRLVSSPVSRDWCADWKSVSVFCWDTFLVGALASVESPELARLNFEAVTAAIDALGMVPNYYFSHGAASRDRSMPPLGASMIWKTQAPAPDRRWLRDIFPRLARWHEFWMARRDGDGDGLLEWGSDAAPEYAFPQMLQDNPQLQHSAKCAMYESGLDNSPMYDDAVFNAGACTLELADIGLNAYYALDCEALAAIADCVGKRTAARRYRAEYEQMKARVNERLWDEAAGIYCNRHWDGRLSGRWSPTSFLPLIAGVAPRERAERLVRAHLLNEREFWGEWALPSISRADPAFGDNDYWRGRIWGPFNFLVAEGLRRYRFDDVAADFASKSLGLFMKNWRADGGVYENYNAVSGAGGDVWNAARLYHWGGLMALIAVQELIDCEPNGWLRIGSQRFPDATVRHVRCGADVFEVELGAGVVARRNGAVFLESTTRAIIRIPLGAPPERPIEISASESGRLRLAGVDRAARRAVLNGGPAFEGKSTRAAATYTWRVGAAGSR